MNVADAPAGTRYEYGNAIIRVMHREETNDYVYIATFPFQVKGVAISEKAALKSAKAEIDLILDAQK